MKACFASEMRGVDKAASEIGGYRVLCLWKMPLWLVWKN